MTTLRWLARSAATGSTLALLGLSVILWGFGSLGGARAWLHGHVLFVDDPVGSAVAAAPGEQVRIQFRMRNLTSGSVTINGAVTDCSCAVLQDLPAVVAARDEITLTFLVDTFESDRGATSTQQAELFTDPPGRQIILGLRVSVPAE